ncbi:hypothetical protein [Plantactinospora sonchi]|uniref:ESX-1 secretion-associated protein n=1 Tax=Plantactinospora sonchi TaxID=1544735 RepID=A0ABU7RL39_9ACTN
MGNPGKEQIRASIQALYTDSRAWGNMAEQLEGMERVARGLALGAFEFSGFAHMIGLDSLYNELQEKMADLLKQGSANFDAIAGALRTAADNYARDEERAVHRHAKIY